jgi:hypothetical protein
MPSSDAIEFLLTRLDPLVERLRREHVPAAIAATVGQEFLVVDEVAHAAAGLEPEVVGGGGGVEVLHFFTTPSTL